MGATWNETPSANRLHIGVFGKTNSGKSSFINAFTGQEVSIVADVAGTTTDPVYKAMEIYPMGPCTIMDTAGFDDESTLGEQREKSYRKLLWDYRPITDFWRVGPGYAKKLAENGMYTMGDVARCSIGKETDYYNEDLLYKLFGVNAELLIDHAWGYEPCTIAQIKAYRPQANSSGSGQVLQCPYPADKARIVVQEMTDQLVLDLVEHGFVTDQIVLTVGYDIENLTDPVRAKRYHGEVTTDRYGRKIPKHAHGTANLQNHTSSAITVVEKTLELYDRIINPDLLIRRIYVTACHVRTEQEAQKEQTYEQMSLFDFAEETEEQKAQKQALQKEKQMQKAMLSIKQRYGKNAILKGTNFKEGATMRQRNGQIGGHRA